MKNKVTGNGLFHVFGTDNPELIEIKTFDESKPKFEMAEDKVMRGKMSAQQRSTTQPQNRRMKRLKKSAGGTAS